MHERHLARLPQGRQVGCRSVKAGLKVGVEKVGAAAQHLDRLRVTATSGWQMADDGGENPVFQWPGEFWLESRLILLFARIWARTGPQTP